MSADNDVPGAWREYRDGNTYCASCLALLPPNPTKWTTVCRCGKILESEDDILMQNEMDSIKKQGGGKGGGET